MERKKNMSSNRGAALLSVIIVMTVVGILATLVLSLSYTNFQMKQVNRNSKDNFYTAEMVLDEVCVGIQKEASTQYESAYISVMEQYGVYTRVDDMKLDFKTNFVLNMVEEFKNGTNREQYDVEMLRDYIDPANYPSDAVITISTPTNGNELDTLEDGLCLRNVSVTYEDGSYVNTIKTDIKISSPDISFAMIATIPEIANYSIIADDGIYMNTSAMWDVNGEIFAGLDEDVTGAEVSVNLQPGAVLNTAFANTTSFISEGDVSITGASGFYTGESTSLWTDSITASSTTNNNLADANNTLSLLGRTYVKDDTTINGTGNDVTIGGQYYGYSNNDTNAGASSAIIINGQDTELDLSELDTLVLAGTAFVGTNGEQLNSENVTVSDVLLGDSIAIKSNQVAYMVPTECDGVVSNPMTYEQWDTLENTTNWKAKILSTRLSSIQRTIDSYGNVDIVPVFTQKSGGAVYLYLEFKDANLASQYFMDYYEGSAGNRIQNYLESYITAIDFRNDATSGDLGANRLITQGNYLVPATYSAGKWSMEYAGNTGNASSVAQELVNYSSSYTALCKKMITNLSALTTEERSRTVFQNLINEELITGTNQFLEQVAAMPASQLTNVTYSAAGTERKAIISTGEAIGTDVIEVVIVDNPSTVYTVPVGFQGIVIATGDVNVSNDAEGLIICDGTLTMTGGSTGLHKVLKSNTDVVGKAMQMACSVGDDNEYSVMNFFVGGGNFSLNSSNTDGERTDVRNIISFENWESE